MAYRRHRTKPGTRKRRHGGTLIVSRRNPAVRVFTKAAKGGRRALNQPLATFRRLGFG